RHLQPLAEPVRHGPAADRLSRRAASTLSLALDAAGHGQGGRPEAGPALRPPAQERLAGGQRQRDRPRQLRRPAAQAHAEAGGGAAVAGLCGGWEAVARLIAAARNTPFIAATAQANSTAEPRHR